MKVCQESLCANETCAYVPKADGVACTTADAGDGVCEAGACLTMDLCVNIICPNNLPFCFERSVCNSQTGLCSQAFKPDGTPCSDGLVRLCASRE
jgi:hypothetical protein